MAISLLQGSGTAAPPREGSRQWRYFVAVALVAVACGWMVAVGKGLLVVGVAGLLAVATVPNRRQLGIAIVLVVIAGYVIADKLFAYFGLSVGGLPAYPGEIALAVGFVALLGTRSGVRWLAVREITIAFLAWATLVFVVRWGTGPPLDTIRDFAIVYYAAFAFFGFILPWERADSRVFSLIAFVFVLQLLYAAAVLSKIVPAAAFGGFVDVIARGDIEGANLIGGAAFFLLADERLRVGRAARIAFATLAVILALVTYSRAVLLGIAILLVATVFTHRGRAAKLFVTVLVGLGLFVAIGGISLSTIGLQTRNRGSISVVTSFERALATVGVATGGQGLGQHATDTYQWRMRWWDLLWQDSVQRPGWMVAGRGFGQNLAVEVGYEPAHTRASLLRAPHSIAVDIFARLGVIGIILWTVWMGSIWWAGYRVAQTRGPTGMLAHWMLTYWSAILMTALFGVILESPFGAVPFFFLTGAIIRLESRRRSGAYGQGERSFLPQAGTLT